MTVKASTLSSNYGKGGVRIPGTNLQLTRRQAIRLVHAGKVTKKSQPADVRLLAKVMFAQ
jgi:hypothetical protein